MAGWRAGPRPMAVVGLIAAFAAVAVGIAPSGTGFALPGPVETTANQGLWLRESAAGGVLRGLELRRCSHQLYLRGAGDDDDEADAEEGGNEEGEMEDAEAEEDEDDPDAGPMTITKAIRQVLYHARNHYGVAKGIKEVCQALERGEAQLVILAEDCDHEDYVKLVTSLTAEKGVYLIKVPEKAKLGDWAGQHKLDADANVKKTCPSSCVAIKDFGEQSIGLAFLLQYIKSQQTDEGAEAIAAEAENEAGEGAEEMDAVEDGGGDDQEGDEEDEGGE